MKRRLTLLVRSSGGSSFPTGINHDILSLGLAMRIHRYKGMLRVTRMTSAQRDRQVKRERVYWQKQLEKASLWAISPGMRMLLEEAALQEKRKCATLDLDSLPF